MSVDLYQTSLHYGAVYDELSADGVTPRPHWAHLMESLRAFAELARTPEPAIDLGLGALLIAQIEHPDLERFPCLRLAYEALRAGGTMPACLNAANEELVAGKQQSPAKPGTLAM